MRNSFLGFMCYVILLLVLAAPAAHAAEGDYVWAYQFGNAYRDFGWGIAVDNLGSVYSTGNFYGTVDFDPDAGTASLTSAGDNDIYVSKFDLTGSLLWARQLGGTGSDRGLALTTDAAGNVYVTGRYVNTVDFDPGSGVANLTSRGGDDTFILKLDTYGNFIWARSLGGVGEDYGFAIEVDNAGNVYTTGPFKGTSDFDPGVGTFYLSAPGYYGAYVSKLDVNGNFAWARLIRGSGDVTGSGISMDNAGNVYTVGYFEGTTDFDPGVGVASLVSAGGQDAFVSKLDMNGNYLWAEQFGGTDNDASLDCGVDSAGNVLLTGGFGDTVDFDPGPGTFNLVSLGFGDICVLKLDASGALVWVKQMGGTSSQSGRSLALDDSDNVYITGYHSGTADFDPGPATHFLTGAGNWDGFAAKLDANGNFGWAKVYGGTDAEYSECVAADNLGNVYTTGYFWGASDFDPGVGVANLSSAGDYDIFICKLSGPPDAAPPVISNLYAVPSIAWVGNTVTIRFSVSETLQSDPTVTVNGNVATLVNKFALNYAYTYTVTVLDSFGPATIEIIATDNESHTAVVANSNALTIVDEATLPLALWPTLLALAAAGAIALRRPRHQHPQEKMGD